MKRKQKIRYVSIKLPACGNAYPLDKLGCRKLPNYTREYLKKHARKLANILHTKVPPDVCSELMRFLEQKEGRALFLFVL